MSTGQEEDQPSFSTALRTWRERRDLPKKRLAATMGFDASYLSHVEAGRMHASKSFARRAEEALDAGGELWDAWKRDPGSTAGDDLPAPDSLVVEDDYAELSYDGSHFRASQRRVLLNGGTDPVTRYLMRISVDRYPGQPQRSNALYRSRPLTWDELGLTASCDGEPTTWKVKADRDAFKEAWLCFENDRGRFPFTPVRPRRSPIPIPSMTAGGVRGSSVPSGFPPAGCPSTLCSLSASTPSCGEPRRPPLPRPSRCAPGRPAPSVTAAPYSPGQPQTRRSAHGTGSNGGSAVDPTTTRSTLSCAPRQNG